MSALSERSAVESMFSRYDLGPWSNDHSVPYLVAIKIRPETQLGPVPDPWQGSVSLVFEQQILNAVQLAAQAKGFAGGQAEGTNRLVAEIIDDWCGTPPRPGPRPHWGSIVEQLGKFGDRFPAGSLLSVAAFDLARRVVNRAHEAHSRANT